MEGFTLEVSEVVVATSWTIWLSAEELRDSLMAVAGTLDRTPGERHPIPPESAWGFSQHVPFATFFETDRRSVYLINVRNRRHPFLGLFDGADPNATTPARQATTVPTQALYFLNDPFFHDRAAALLRAQGQHDYLIEVGGEILAAGSWRVGVEDPEGGAGHALRLPAEPGTAVMTSGTYRHYFEANGRRYSHIIDPRTGAPVDHSLLEVTVVAHDGARAGAWGTALLCLGPEAASQVADHERIAALFAVQTAPDSIEQRQSAAIAMDWPGLMH